MGKAAAEREKRTTTSTDDPVADQLAIIEARQRFYGTVLNMGWRLAATFLAPLLIGIWLDKRFDSSPSYTICGLFLAVAGAVYVIRDTIRDVNEESAAEEKAEKSRVKNE